jgi:hypothetical protein
MAEPPLTERQRKWFASMRGGLERDTGKTLEEWKAIALTCPETAPRARLKWFKDAHGLMQNRASYVLSEAFGSAKSWSDPDALIDSLWADPGSRVLLETIDRPAQGLDGVIRTARKGYTAWSRKVQFAAARPVRGGKLMLGLAVTPDASPRLETPRNESWSERLKARVLIAGADEIDQEIEGLLKAAWERS